MNQFLVPLKAEEQTIRYACPSDSESSWRGLDMVHRVFWKFKEASKLTYRVCHGYFEKFSSPTIPDLQNRKVWHKFHDWCPFHIRFWNVGNMALFSNRAVVRTTPPYRCLCERKPHKRKSRWLGSRLSWKPVCSVRIDQSFWVTPYISERNLRGENYTILSCGSCGR